MPLWLSYIWIWNTLYFARNWEWNYHGACKTNRFWPPNVSLQVRKPRINCSDRDNFPLHTVEFVKIYRERASLPSTKRFPFQNLFTTWENVSLHLRHDTFLTKNSISQFVGSHTLLIRPNLWQVLAVSKHQTHP